MRRAGIVVIGDEVLSGFTRDINLYHLASRLRDLGVECTVFIGVRDRDDDIATALRVVAEGWDPNYIITTGGLGITHDDITVEAISRGLGLSLKEDRKAQEYVMEAMDKVGERDVDESSLKKLYMVPEGFVPLPNPVGVAPGLVGEVYLGGRRRTLIILPGVPAEAEGIFRSSIEGKILKSPEDNPVTFKEVIVEGRESQIHNFLRIVMEEYKEIKIGSYPQGPGAVLIRMSGPKEVLESGVERMVELLQEAGVSVRIL